RFGVEHLTQQVRHAVEVWNQVLHPGAGIELVDLAYCLGVQPGTLVVEVVARDTGDRGVPQLHLLYALGHPSRLVGVQLGGLPGVDLAEVTPPGALLATNQEGGLAVLPALEDVRTTCLLADRVQSL